MSNNSNAHRYIIFVCPVDDYMPAISAPCDTHAEAIKWARNHASEYQRTMRLFLAPSETPNLSLLYKSPEHFLCYVEPAKPANDGRRGIFVSNPITIRPKPIIHSPELDPQELRFWLLFWDEIAIPTNNVDPRVLSRTEEYLRSEGVLRKFPYDWVCEPDDDELLRDSFIFGFNLLNKQEPGKWSAAVGGKSITFPVQETKRSRSALVRLYQSVPIPAAEVSLQDVLEFREHRRDELLGFRYHVETVFSKIVDAGDGALAWNSEVEALERSISDLVKSTRGSSIKFLKGSFDAKLNLPSAAAAAMAAHSFGFSAVGTLMSAAAAGIAVQVGAGLKDRPASKTPFSYVAKYHSELRWL